MTTTPATPETKLMKLIGTAPTSSTPNLSQSASGSNSARLISAAISSLKTIFPGWRATFKTDLEHVAYRREFLFSLVQFDIRTIEQIEFGISRARVEAQKGLVFLPSGAQFAGWCKPTAEDVGIEPFETAYNAVIHRQWERVHPAFQHVARGFDVWKLRTMSDRDARREFRELYDAVVSRVVAGEVFKRINALPINPVKTSATPEQIKARAAAEMAKCLAMMSARRS